MFKLVLSEKEIKKVRTFCAHGFFGARINTTLAAYGTDDRFVRTWYEENNNHITAVAQLTQAAAVVQCTPDADFDSLAVLLQFAGAKTVTGEKECMEKLGLPQAGRGYLMTAEAVVSAQTKAEKTDSELLALLYPVLFGETARKENPTDFAVWYADLSHRVRHGLCECFAVFEEKEAVSCASVLYSNAQYGCIGAVATRPEHRRRGFGSACTLTAAQSVLANGQTPCLACADGGIHKWYESMGFAVSGEWAEASI